MKKESQVSKETLNQRVGEEGKDTLHQEEISILNLCVSNEIASKYAEQNGRNNIEKNPSPQWEILLHLSLYVED